MMNREHNKKLLGVTTVSLLIGLLSFTSRFISAAKIDCHPITGASREACESIGCIWSPVNRANQEVSSNNQELSFDTSTLQLIKDVLPAKSEIEEPWCYFPEDYVGYKVTQLDANQFKLTRQRPSGLPNDVAELKITVDSYGVDNSLLRVRVFDANQKRFEPNLPELQLVQLQNQKDSFHIEVDQHDHLVIKRTSTGAIIFDTDLTKLIFSDQFIQLNSKLSSRFLFGLGEHYGSFLKQASDNYKSYSFYHTDRLPLPDGTRSYGGFPFYINLDSDNEQYAHGLYLHNTNAMDIILQPDQSITFRPIGGILDFFFFAGPEAIDVISQYQKLVGLPQLPPRWALGFHLCRYNYNTLEKTELVWNRTRAAGIPFDVQWNDIDYMNRHNDFTYDHEKFKDLPDFVEKLHDSNMHYVFLFDPGVSQEENYYPYSLGAQMDIFVKNATNQTLIGKVWNDSGKTVFPDFSNPKSIEYWTELFTKMQAEVKFDGAWIDMNDISSFVYGSLDGCPILSIESPPYRPGGYNLQEKSLCLSAKHQAGYEYNVHNLYSFYEAIATFKALQTARPGRRPLIISRSTSPGQGSFGGHWSGDVLSTWDYLRWSIPSLIEHSMYGFSLMGSDICGFVGDTNPELCARWSTLGAFYTFTRNHNDDVSIDQDPVALGQDVVDANKNALSKKYSLIPYLYTLLHRATRFGEPAIRSVPLEFYTTDKEALKVEHQFMWGKALMISPVVDQNTYTKSTYLPKGRWYEQSVLPSAGYWSSKSIDSKGEWHETRNISITDIPLFYRGGYILPVYSKVAATLKETANQNISLEVALCQMNKAHGELYLDDGDNIDNKYNHLIMSFENNKLTITQDEDSYSKSTEIGKVRFLGISSGINSVKANGKPISFVRIDDKLFFDLEGISITNDRPIVVELFPVN